MTAHPRLSASASKAASLRRSLPKLAIARSDLDAVAMALGRIGPLSIEVGGHSLTLKPAPPGKDSVGAWWKLTAGRYSVLFAVSGDILPQADPVPPLFALEVAFDPILDALETHLGLPVDVEEVKRPRSLPHRRCYDLQWGAAQGRLSLAFAESAAPLVGAVMAALPFEAPPARDVMVQPLVRIGRFPDTPDRLFRMTAGEILLPADGDLRADVGALTVAGREFAPVTLDSQGARIADAGEIEHGPASTLAADGSDAVTFSLLCEHTARATVHDPAVGTILGWAADDPTQVLIKQRDCTIGTGTLIRFGSRLAVELRGWSPGFACVARHCARTGRVQQNSSDDAHLVRMLKDRRGTLCT